MKRLLRILFLALLVVVLLPYALTPFYRFGQPVSTLMLARWATGQPVQRDWRDLGQIADILPRTVVAAEDSQFCTHQGVDWDLMQQLLEEAQEGEVVRGGSTITQQVAKNLFLWHGRSVVRKALELPLAVWIEFVLPKQRILEIYLNIAEWGPNGQFGAEAGAQKAFGKSSARLAPREAALMAAILPNPRVRSAQNPSPGVRRRASIYVARARLVSLAECRRAGRS